MSTTLRMLAVGAILATASSARAGLPCSAPLGDWWQPPAPTAVYDHDNCNVQQAPNGLTPFVADNAWYVEPVYDVCTLGTWDLANCYIRAVPPGAIVFDDRFYTLSFQPGVCPPDTQPVGLYCLWYEAPPGTTAFTYDGNWYTTGAPRCPVGQLDTEGCYIGRPPAGETAHVWSHTFQYGYDEVLNSDAAQVARTCGESFGDSDLNGCMNRVAPPAPSIRRGISVPDADYHPTSYRAGRADNDGQVRWAGPPVPEDAHAATWPWGPGLPGDTAQLPATRSSNDGRVVTLNHQARPALRVLRPEMLGHDDVLLGGLPWSELVSVPAAAIYAPQTTGLAYHSTVCDVSGSAADPSGALAPQHNPRTCQATVDNAVRTGDCYDLTLLNGTADGMDWRLSSVDITVFVSDPKTANARPWLYPRIAGNVLGTQPALWDHATWNAHRRVQQTFLLDVNGNGVQDPDVQTPDGLVTEAWVPQRPWQSTYRLPDGFTHNRLALFELVTTSDGNVLFVNTMHGVYYAVNDQGPCRADGFGELRPLSFMPSDPRVAYLDLARSGAATGGFRDPNGAVITPGTPMVGAYMWVDRQGKNLFFGRSNVQRSAWHGTLRGAEAHLEKPTQLDQDAGKGTVVMGAWTQGKIVVLDNMLNATDWGGAKTTEGHSVPGGDYYLHRDETEHPNGRFPQLAFDVPLYQDDPLPVRPLGTALINSPENQFNHLDGQSPTLPFDVVWRVMSNNGHTAEVAFDDYMNNQALVVAHMNASQKTVPHEGLPHPVPSDGFVPCDGLDYWFDETPQLQNASTAHPSYDPGAVQGPSTLALRGGARVEPVALGGVLGKGVYLDGRNDFIDMRFPGTSHPNWYLGIWLDNRALSPTQTRRVFTFDDGSWIGFGLDRLVFHSAWGIPAEQSIDLSALALPAGQYVHLGVVIRRVPWRLTFEARINGDPTPVGMVTWAGNPGYEMHHDADGDGQTRLVVGDPGEPGRGGFGFHGWVDELRVIALTEPQVQAGTAAADAWLELGCNYALGTVVRAPGGTLYCEQVALVDHDTPLELGPQHGMAACIDRVHRNPITGPGAPDCARRSLLGTTSGVQAGSPRADFGATPFCQGCHLANHPIPGLRPDALDPGIGPRECDRRRQPMDWPAVIGGAALSNTAPSGSHATCPPSAAGATLSDGWFDVHGKWTP